MTDICAPCDRYTPDSELPVERCCTTCSHLDDEEPCAELCRRFAELEARGLLAYPRPGGDPPSTVSQSIAAFGASERGRGGNT